MAVLTEETCIFAWAITKQAATEAATTGVTNKLAGTIIVLNPWDGTILFEERLDESHSDKDKYDEIAKAKAQVSRDTGLSSREVQQNAPYLYTADMTKWGGSVVENKLVVAFSGVQAIFDEAIAATMLRWIVALCQNEMTRPGGIMSSDDAYISTFVENFDVSARH